MTQPSVSYKRHRFPPAIIAHAVWLYFRFPVSLRLVEEMLLERGIVVSYETVRRWAMKFGRDYARRLKHKTPSRRDIWHLDEIVVSIGGKKHWLWRAVDQDGYIRNATREHDAEPTNLALGGRLSTRWPVLRVPCSRCRPARDSGRWNFARGADSKERYRIAPRRPDVPNRLQFCASYVSGARCESRDETVSFRCTANRGFYFRAVGEAPGLHYLSAWAMRSCHRSAPRLSSSHASARPRWSSRADECLVLNAACAVRVTFDRSR